MACDDSDLKVPATYTPMSEKEAEVACGYDYEFEDFRTADELYNDLNKIIAMESLR